MASTWSDLKFELIGTGEQSGTWGTTTNANIGDAIEQAIGGKADITMSSTSITISLTDTTALQNARALYLNLTGTPGGAATLNVPAVQKSYIVYNNTTGGFAVTVKVSGQTGVSVPNGKVMVLYDNGTDVVDAITHLSSLTLGSALAVASGGTGVATLTANNVVLGNGTSAVQFVAPGSVGNVLTSNGTTWTSSAPASTSPGGSDTQVQFNDGGSFGGDAGLTYNKTTDTLTTSVVVHGAGSASAPSITATGDTNTGVFFPAADTAAISTGGTERLRVDSNGRLFVGDTSVIEDAKFEVVGAKFYTVGIPRAQIAAVDSTAIATGVGGAINFVGKYTGSTYTSFGSVEGYKENATDGNYAGSLVFKTRANGGNQNEQMRIDSSGNLLVGTTSAVTGSKLVVDTGDATIYGVRVGRGAGAVSTNTAVGASALATNSTGSLNTAVGWQALLDNTTASGNTAVGYRSLENSTASANTAVGDRALVSNTSGANNTAVGTQALTENTTGANNTAVGYQALDLATSSDNAAFGAASLGANTTGRYNVAVGANAGGSVTTGTDHVSLGFNAGNTVTTGSYGVYIGSGATASASSAGSEIVICHYNATGKGSNTGYMVPGSGGMYQGNNSSSWSTTSDRRLKKNIVDNNEGLDVVSQIRVRNFEYRLPEEVDAELKPTDAVKKEGIQLGVIAQELQEVCPDCVKEESTGVLSVDSDNVFWHMVNAIKQLKTELDSVKAELATLKGA
jgi:hypothetical protein